jgi:hypothetical protein
MSWFYALFCLLFYYAYLHCFSHSHGMVELIEFAILIFLLSEQAGSGFSYGKMRRKHYKLKR